MRNACVFRMARFRWYSPLPSLEQQCDYLIRYFCAFIKNKYMKPSSFLCHAFFVHIHKGKAQADYRWHTNLDISLGMGGDCTLLSALSLVEVIVYAGSHFNLNLPSMQLLWKAVLSCTMLVKQAVVCIQSSLMVQEPLMCSATKQQPVGGGRCSRKE